MPLIDMPLNQLVQYEGRSVKPADFDQFWDLALAEMRQVDPNITLTKAAFQVPFAECYDLSFTGTENARIYCKMVKPRQVDTKQHNSKAPAILRFHGYTASSGDWTSLLHYAAAGFIAVAMDCRGQGGQSEDVSGSIKGTLYGFIVKGAQEGPSSLYFKHVFLDTAKLAGIVFDMPDVDTSRVYASGQSQGGALTLACAALEPRISRLAPVYPFLSDYKRVWEMDLAVRAYEGISKYFRHFDPTHDKETEFFRTLSYIDIQHLASRIKGAVLLAVGLMDDICPASSQFACYNKIQSPKDFVVYPDFGHEHLPGHNDRELLFFLQD